MQQVWPKYWLRVRWLTESLRKRRSPHRPSSIVSNEVYSKRSAAAAGSVQLTRGACSRTVAGTRSEGWSSDHGFQPLAIQQIEELERRPARMLFADLPLPNRRHAGVENRRQDCLADPVPHAQGANRLTGIFRYRYETQGVVILHPALGD